MASPGWAFSVQKTFSGWENVITAKTNDGLFKDNTTKTKAATHKNNLHEYIIIMYRYMAGIADSLSESGFLTPN